ncbi:MAG: hypothetical protein H7X99_07460 [Saprospiraceae bacterium]|nr:hypothetical protein [Saprospiraceae bacterium]
MDILPFKRKLNKINVLIDSAGTDGEFTVLEKDLMLSYIRDLYEIVLEDKTLHSIKQTHSPFNKHREQSAEISTIPSVKEPEVSEKKVEQSTGSHYVPNTEEKTIESPRQAIIQPSVVDERKSEVIEDESKTHRTSKQVNEKFLSELFADEKITDLSDKLSQSAVKDLSKSMGINERIFTQQELFGNNQSHFNETLEGLNKCQNFEEAKQYLIKHVIFNYDWASENKSKKAATFIKLVKRKFV